MLREGKLEDRMVEVEVADKTFPSFEIVTNQGVEEMDINVKEMLPGLFGGKKKRRKTSVSEARQILQAEEEGRLIDPGQVAREAVERAQSSGIVFLDEIDKVAGRESGGRGPDVSREGVQRDLLPIVEGTSVNTKYGFVKTDHVLFIAAGAFHVSKPSDLIPELQGRFPIRVELDSLTEADFVRILTEPENALLKQYHALLGAEGVDLGFSEEAIGEIARDAERVNRALENIGARRLHTILERLLEDISFAGPENAGKSIRIELADVQGALADLVKDEDLSRYVLVSRRGSARRRSLALQSPILSPAARRATRSRRCREGPNAVTDLAVEQEGDDAVLTFSFPDRLLTGAPLTDLESIEVFRVVNAPPGLTAPAGTGTPAGAGGTSSAELRGLGQSERRAATNVRLAEEAFYRDSERVAALSLPAIAERDAGRLGRLPQLARRPVFAGRRAAASRLRRRFGAAQWRAQPALQHRVDHARHRAPGAGASRPHPRRGARLPRVDRAPAERALPAGRDRRLPRLSPAAVGGGVRHAAEPAAGPGDVLRGSDGAVRRASGVHRARDPREEPEGRGTPGRGARRRSAAIPIRRRVPRGSTRCRSPTSCGSSGIPWTPPISRDTWSIGRRAAARSSD